MRFLTRSIVALFLGAMALGLLAVAGGMVRSTIEARAARQDAPRVARERVFAARVVTIEPGAVAPVLSAFGEVVSRRTLELRATAAGRILTLADGFEEGAPVRAGEVLVQLDPADAEAARDLVRADLARAEDERDDARRALELSHLDRAEAESQADIRRRAFERQQGLAERGIGTAATVEDAELAYAAARASVIARRQAEAAAQARVTTAENALERQRINLAEAERRVADTTVTASFDGVLSDTNAVAGGQVSMNERLASVIDPGALEVSFRLSTAQYLRLLDGQGALMPARAEIALEMGGAEITSPGTLTRVAPSVGAGQSGRLVYAAIDAPRGFRPGDFVTVRITEPVLPGVAQVPASAVDSTGGVLVLGAEDRLEAASVEVVRRQGDSVLIRAPALAGRDVVAARNPLLGVGIRVRPQRDQGAAAAQPEAPDLVALDPERRAALIARVSSNTMMPEGVRTRILAQLEQEQVPARLIERLEQGGGRPRQGAEAMAGERKLASQALGLFRYFTRHRTAANLVLVLMLAAGLFAVPRMHAQYFPDVVIDNVVVTIPWAGAGSSDVDSAIVQVVEPALMGVEGVASSESRASEGRAVVTLEFEPGWDIDRAAGDVQDALDLITTLPEDADDPRVTRSAWRDRVTNVVISGPVGVDQLAHFTDEFVARLFTAGITRTTIQGIASPEIAVEVPSMRLVQYDITLSAISQAINASISADPSGDLAGGAQRVRTGTQRRTPAEIGAIVLRSDPDGRTLTVGDVATVHLRDIDRERAYFVGGNQAIVVRVDRSQNGDAIGIQDSVQQVADQMMLTLPEGVRIDLTSARADQIANRLNLLMTNGAQGLVLVVLLLFLFLNARTALWVAAGIPVSMLAAVAFMYVTGMSLNMISLFALIITLGIVVDDAIVVGEHADWRYRTLREGAAEAAENAATRMGIPVLAASLTTIIAFAGLTVIGGRFGDMIADIPWTVIAVLIASLLECFLILPNHMSHALAGSARDHWYDWPSRMVNRGFDAFRDKAFQPFMRLVIRARYVVLAGLVVLLAWAATAFLSGAVTWRFFSSPEQGTLSANYVMTPEATRDDTMAMMRELQRAADAVAGRMRDEHGAWPIASMVSEVGGNVGRGLASAANRDADQLGSLTIDLIDADLRPYSSFEFTAMLQDELRQSPLLEEMSFRTFGAGPGGDSLSVDLIGQNADALKGAAEALKTILAQFPQVTGLEDTLAYDKEELVLQLTPQGQALGFSTDVLARELRQRLSGIEAAVYPDGVRSAAVRVSLPEGERAADFLENTLLRSAGGRYLPLGDIVQVETRQGFSSILRENGLQLVTVSGVLDEDDPEGAQMVLRRLSDEILPRLAEDHGVTWRLSGLAEQENDFLTDAALGAVGCLIAIYLVLAWVFSSWLRPLVVMAVIPFGMIGVVFGHMQWGIPLTMFSVVGIIGMAGIIINDSIVLVSTVDEYAAERGLLPSIADAAADRLRPVLLTTATTVMGLGPLLFERSNDAQFLRPTVVTLSYGLGFGMVLVLLIVPSLLAAGHDLSRMRRSLMRAFRLPGGQVGAGLRVLPWIGAAWVALAFALTLGWTVALETAGPLTALALPGAADGLVPALGVFAATVAAGLAALWGTGMAVIALSRRKPAPPAKIG